MEELETLCFQLGVHYEDLQGETREAKARELVEYMQRNGRLPELHDVLARERSEQYRQMLGSTVDIELSAAAPPHSKSGARPFPVWGWALGLLALAILVVWAAMNLSGRNRADDLATTIPGATEIATDSNAAVFQPMMTSTDPPLTVLPNATDSALLPQVGDILTTMRDDIEVEQVYVPAGSFHMGSQEDDNERPVHEVSLDGFWIDRTEVTIAQFEAFVNDTGVVTTAESEGWGYLFDGEWVQTEGVNWRQPLGPESDWVALPSHPVSLVSWYDAVAFCEWTGGRLPTEAEWEYAARGPQNFTFPWGDEFRGDYLNYCDASCLFDWADEDVSDGFEFFAPVGSYSSGASWVNALDMAGNVWEWVEDWYRLDYYSNSQAANPQGPASGEFKVTRGGGWSGSSFFARTTDRNEINDPYDRYVFVGFRCAQD